MKLDSEMHYLREVFLKLPYSYNRYYFDGPARVFVKIAGKKWWVDYLKLDPIV